MLTLFALFAGILHENRCEGKTRFPPTIEGKAGPSGQMQGMQGIIRDPLHLQSFQADEPETDFVQRADTDPEDDEVPGLIGDDEHM